MAKIKLGAIVVDMRGKLGGHVFAKNRGGNYMRTKTTPVNPQTTAQTNVRSIFAGITSNWSSLTEAQRESFNSKVSDYGKTNVFGDLKNPSGKALYQRLNQNLALTGQTQITVCPSPAAVPAISNASGIAYGETQSINLSYIGDATGSQVMVNATGIVSNGTSYVKNRLRTLYVASGAEDGSISIGTQWTNKNGAFAAGDVIFFALKVVNAQGQASPEVTFKVTAEE